MVDVADLRIKVTADTKDYQAGLKKGQAATKSFTDKWDGFKSQAGNFLGGLAIAGVAVQQSFQFAQQGANIAQLGDSFDGFLDSVGAAPDLLNRLREASRGTVDDATLMSSVMTLIAGTSDEMARSLTASTPALLEIAKAANKLNPSLGDTTFLFESIATGIKRASPLILDNLGLTIDITQAYEEYAQQLGIARAALTAEQESQALLNAVLQSGQQLIAQAGGSTESAADSFARMEAAITNARHELAQRFAPSLATAAEAIALLITWNSRLDEALENNQQEILSTAESYDEYIDRQLEAIVVARRGSQTWADNMRQIALSGSLTNQHAAEWDLLTEAQYNALRASEELTGHMDRGRRAQEQLREAVENTIVTYNDMALSNMSLEERIKNLGMLVRSTFSEDFANAQEDILDLRTEAGQLESTIADLEGREYLTSAQQEELAETRIALQGVQQEIDDTTAAWDRQTAQMIFDMAQQRLAIDGLTADEFAALTALAGPEGLGLVDEAAAQMAESVNAALVEFEDTGDIENFNEHLTDLQVIASNTDQTLSEMEGDIAGISATFELAQDPINNYRDALNSIPPTISTILTINQVLTTTGQVIDLGSGQVEAFATGGAVGAGTLVKINEFGEEFFMPNVDGTILPASSPVGGGGGGSQDALNFSGMSQAERAAFAAEIGQAVATSIMVSGENL